MATPLGYPSFSAPATLERRTRWSNWLSNAKEAFMRPWRLRRPRMRRRHPAAGTPPGPRSLTSFEQGLSSENRFQQQVFPNFGNRLSPLGGRPQSKGKAGDDCVDGAAEVGGGVKLPENPGPSRPPLSNVFPMLVNSPQVTKPIDSRRHSTPVISIPTSRPKSEERRESASSDTSAEKPRHGRRERRASVTRELPLLPKRGDNPFHTPSPVTSTPQVSPYSELGEPTPTLFPIIDTSRPDQITMNFGPVSRPPVAPGGAVNSFTYPPMTMWLQPYQQLQELEEELEEDGEGDGEEQEITRIDEVDHGQSEEEEDFKPTLDLDPSFVMAAPNPSTSSPTLDLDPSFVMTAPNNPPTTSSPRETSPANKGALSKILRIMSSSSSKGKTESSNKPAAVGRLPSGVVLEQADEADVKGFDNFFLY